MAGPIDRQAVDRLVIEHLPVALRLALRLAGHRDAADEVVQEALVRVLDRWQSFRGESSFRTWMLGIVINADRDRRRRQAARPQQALPTADPACREPPPEAAAATEELKAHIRAAIDQLPDRQREVAILCLGEGLSAREVARIVSISESNVYASLHHARRRIAAAIGVELTPHAPAENTPSRDASPQRPDR